MPAYLRYDVVDLPHVVGKNVENGTRISTGEAGHLSFGPFCSLDAGDYIAGFYVRRIENSGSGRIDMDICGLGFDQIALRHFADNDIHQTIAGLIHAEFSLPAPVSNVEVRLYVPEGVRVEMHELVIFNTRSRGWGGL